MSKKRNTPAVTPATAAAGPTYKIQRRAKATISDAGDGPQVAGEPEPTKTVVAWVDRQQGYGSKVEADKALDTLDESGVFRVVRIHPAFVVEVEQRNVITSRKPVE